MNADNRHEETPHSESKAAHLKQNLVKKITIPVALICALGLVVPAFKSSLYSNPFADALKGALGDDSKKTNSNKDDKKDKKDKKGKKDKKNKKGKKGKKGKGKQAAGEPKAFAGMVNAHNSWRKKYKTPPLKWSKKLAKYAQNWANTLKKTKGCKMQHRNPNKYGENLYWSYGMNPNSKQVVDAWGSEVKDYNYKKNSCKPGKMCGHYTQVIWKSTTHVGCGKATCGSEQVWVCNYNPPGNYVGQKPY